MVREVYFFHNLGLRFFFCFLQHFNRYPFSLRFPFSVRAFHFHISSVALCAILVTIFSDSGRKVYNARKTAHKAYGLRFYLLLLGETEIAGNLKMLLKIGKFVYLWSSNLLICMYLFIAPTRFNYLKAIDSGNWF